MALGILTIFVIHQLTAAGVPDVFHLVNDETGALMLEYSAIMILALTCSGLVMLYQICRPFNPIRATLFVICAAVAMLVVFVPHLGNIFIMKSDAGADWSAVKFNLQQILLLIIIVQAAFPVSSFLIKAFEIINPKDEDEEEKDETSPQQQAETTTK
jgi:hypothetical protein